jgi:hypothetical protein
MKRVSSQPLFCLALFLAGCLCFLVAWNPEWWTGESYGAPAGGRIPGLEPKPAAKTEELVKPEAAKALKEERTPEETSPGKDAVPSHGTP